MKKLFLFLTSCNEDENIDESNKYKMLSAKITRENIITIDKFMLPNEIYVYRVMLDSDNTGNYTSVFYYQNSNTNETLTYFIKNSNQLFSSDGEYLYSFIKEKNSINYSYLNPYNNNLESKSCFQNCMSISFANWTSESETSVGEAFDYITWNSIGETVAAANCGGCCQGWWRCPTLARQTYNNLQVIDTDHNIEWKEFSENQFNLNLPK